MRKDPKKKNIVQDVVPPKRSIRNVELPSRRNFSSQPLPQDEFTRPIPVRVAKTPSPSEDEVIRVVPPERYREEELAPPPLPPRLAREEARTPSYEYEYDEPKKKSRSLLYGSVIVFIIAVAFGVSALFKSAEIRVTPRHETHPLSDTFTAYKDDSTNPLSFQVVTVNGDTDASVPASKEQQVSKKARGTIVIFNDFSANPQKLVATTRFETKEGLIFRLIDPITVPGLQTKNGKSVAGSVEAIVEADKPGNGYNIGLKDFTVPGFKGDPKYTHVFARSKTAMTGGIVGSQKVVSLDDLTAANTSMEAALKEKLSKDLTSQIPANFVLYEGSITYSFSEPSQIGGEGQTAVLKKKGTVTGIIFDKGVLTRAIVAKILPNTTEDTLKITNLESLVFTYATDTGNNLGANTITFTLNGDSKVEWVFDENQLKSELLGLSKTAAKDAIARHKAISEAWIKTQPFWNQTIPTNPTKVKLINTLAQ